MIDKTTEEYHDHLIKSDNNGGIMFTSPQVIDLSPEDYGAHFKALRPDHLDSQHRVPVTIKVFSGEAYVLPEQLVGDFMYMADQCSSDIDCENFHRYFSDYRYTEKMTLYRVK